MSDKVKVIINVRDVDDRNFKNLETCRLEVEVGGPSLFWETDSLNGWVKAVRATVNNDVIIVVDNYGNVETCSQKQKIPVELYYGYD